MMSHAKRMGKLCDWASLGGGYAIADFVCPTKETREAFNPDFVIWVNRIEKGRYEDTNKMFQKPEKYAFKDSLFRTCASCEYQDYTSRLRLHTSIKTI